MPILWLILGGLVVWWLSQAAGKSAAGAGAPSGSPTNNALPPTVTAPAGDGSPPLPVFWTPEPGPGMMINGSPANLPPVAQPPVPSPPVFVSPPAGQSSKQRLIESIASVVDPARPPASVPRPGSDEAGDWIGAIFAEQRTVGTLSDEAGDLLSVLEGTAPVDTGPPGPAMYTQGIGWTDLQGNPIPGYS